jgi:hypothetical protein
MVRGWDRERLSAFFHDQRPVEGGKRPLRTAAPRSFGMIGSVVEGAWSGWTFDRSPPTTWYATGMDRIREVRRTLQPWANHECVRHLDDRFYEWGTTLSALQC